MDPWPKKLSAITLFTEDLAATKRFYAEVFGVRQIFEDPSSVVFDFGNTLINLLDATAVPELIEPATIGDPAGGPRAVMTLDVDDVDAVCAELAKRGVSPPERPDGPALGPPDGQLPRSGRPHLGDRGARSARRDDSRPRYRAGMTTIPLILDVDTGIDDSLALLYVAASPEAELVAVTCVGGNVDARQVERNTRAVMELAGRSDVEVALGRERPLVRPVETTPETHGPQGLGYAELPPATRPLSDRNAVDLFIDGGASPAGRDHARHLRAADEPRPGGPPRAGPAPPPPWLGPDGRRLSPSRQHRPDDRVEHPLRPGCREDRLRGVRRIGGGPRSPAARRPRPRRHRAGDDPPGPRRRPREGRRQHAGRLDRPRPRRGPDAGEPIGREQPDRPLHRRRAPVLHGVPRPLRRVLRGVHPRRRWRSPRPSTRPRDDARR